MTQLTTALAGMVHIPRFFVWRLSGWTGRKFKDKEPINTAGQRFDMGAGPLLDYATATAWLNYWQSQGHENYRYALGWYVMPDAGYWVIDVDGCVEWQDGQPVLNAVAQECLQLLPGVAGEYSSSMHGLHFFGRGILPAGHKTRGKGLPEGMEIYTRERGICFGLSGVAWGNADTFCQLPPHWVIAEDAPGAVGIAGRRPEWVGPEDDNELIRRMLARKEAMAMLRGTATLRQLWEGDSAAIGRQWPDAEDKGGRCSEADAALAAHLAWWTGGDVPRMIRLMQRSALVRDKWTDSRHRNYLHDTCRNAAAALTGCYIERPALPALPSVVVAEVPAPTEALPAWQGVNGAMEIIARAGNVEELQAACRDVAAFDDWSEIDSESLAQRISRKSKELTGEKWPIGLCRKLVLLGETAQGFGEIAKPDWLEEWVYLTELGKYCHVAGNFALLTREAIHVQLCNMPEVPAKPNGEKMEVHKLLSEVWRIDVAHNLGYCPTAGRIYEDGGKVLLNSFYGSMPDAEPWDKAVTDRYLSHLYMVCNRDQETYHHLLYWLAHQVQRPGVLIRWAILLIGRTGTGKTTTHSPVLRALGRGNVKVTNAGAVNNKGGFMDWAARTQCLGILEDLSLSGPEKYANYEKMKPVISDDWVTITRKGQVDDTYRNYANYFGGTNKHDALPITEGQDRRWLMIATSELDAWLLQDKDGLGLHLKELNEAMRSMSDGAWRGFFESIQIPAEWYARTVRAPVTAALQTMQASGETDGFVAVSDILERHDVVAPHALMGYLKDYYKYALKEDDKAIPKTSAVRHMLQQLGYLIAGDKKVKISGVSQRLYTRRAGMSWDALGAAAREFDAAMVAAKAQLLAGVFAK